MRKNPLLLILLHLPFMFFAQQGEHNQVADSLLAELKKAKEDTTKVNNLLALSRQFRYSDVDTALYFANEALVFATKLNFTMGVADSKRALCALYASMGKFDEGLKNGSDALSMYNDLLQSATAYDKEKILAKIGSTYMVIGHNRISQGNYPEALKYSLLCLQIREQLGDKKGISEIKYNIGNIYISQHNYSEALNCYNASLKISEELGNKANTAVFYNVIGLVYIEQKNYHQAFIQCSAALKMAEAAKDRFAIAEVYNNLGIINDKLGNYTQALKCNFNALKEYEETGTREQIPWIYNNIALVYLNQKKYKDAAEYLSKALSLSKELGKLEVIKFSYENWAALDIIQGNYKKGLEDYKLAVLYRDSLLNKENTKKLVQQQMQYDFDKKETLIKAQQDKKDALAKEELQQQRNIRNISLTGLTSLLLFLTVVIRQRNKVRKEKKRSDGLLLNILPAETAEELKATGVAAPKDFEEVTVLFTDFKDFTQASEKMTAHELVNEINFYFSQFDKIITKFNIEKIKTIGDSYMAAGGLPVPNKTNSFDTVAAALEIQAFMQQINEEKKKDGKPFFDIRIGVHTGPVVAGVVGIKKFAYDIWGDTVNIASRMESSGEAGRVNISGSTYELVKDKFICIYRGKIKAKHKGEVDMYFVDSVL